MTVIGRVKWIIKNTLASIMHWTGVLELIRRRTMAGRCVILMYHRVVDESSPPDDYLRNDIVVNRGSFIKQLRYIKKKYHVISLSHLCELLSNGEELPDNSCVITFDDGWRDTFEIALPLTQDYELPITVFVTNNFVSGGNWYWAQRVKYLLSYTRNLARVGRIRIPTAIETDFGIRRLDRASPQELCEITEECVSSLKDDPVRAKRLISILENPIESIRNQEIERPFASWDEINASHSNLLELGAHTMTHPDLTECDDDQVRAEIENSAEDLELRISRHINLFAYPYGKFNQQVRNTVESTSLSAACSTMPALVDISADIFALPRINIYEDVSSTIPMFACRMLRLFGRY